MRSPDVHAFSQNEKRPNGQAGAFRNVITGAEVADRRWAARPSTGARIIYAPPRDAMQKRPCQPVQETMRSVKRRSDCRRLLVLIGLCRRLRSRKNPPQHRCPWPDEGHPSLVGRELSGAAHRLLRPRLVEGYSAGPESPFRAGVFLLHALGGRSGQGSIPALVGPRRSRRDRRRRGIPVAATEGADSCPLTGAMSSRSPISAGARRTAPPSSAAKSGGRAIATPLLQINDISGLNVLTRFHGIWFNSAKSVGNGNR